MSSLVYRMKEVHDDPILQNSVIILFVTGKGMISGVKSNEEANHVQNAVYELFSSYSFSR